MPIGYAQLEATMSAVVFSEKLGKQLRKARDEMGMTQVEFCATTRGAISKQTLSKWENGQRNLTVYRLMQLLSFYPRNARETILQFIYAETVVIE